MITRILIYIKHNLKFIWNIIDWVNSILFNLFYSFRLERILPVVFDEFALPLFSFRKLNSSDSDALFNLISIQNISDLEYFRPHSFTLNSIRKQFHNQAFLMMGVFEGDKLIGYFFLRFFANKKCFVGRLIDKGYRGKGIGPVMNSIMYETSWRMDFHCLSTISRKNTAVMRAHANNRTMVVLKELQNDYLLVEFVREAKSSEVSDER